MESIRHLHWDFCAAQFSEGLCIQDKQESVLVLQNERQEEEWQCWVPLCLPIPNASPTPQGRVCLHSETAQTSTQDGEPDPVLLRHILKAALTLETRLLFGL